MALAVCNEDCLGILSDQCTLVVETIALTEIVFYSVMSIFDVLMTYSEKVKKYRKPMDLERIRSISQLICGPVIHLSI